MMFKNEDIENCEKQASEQLIKRKFHFSFETQLITDIEQGKLFLNPKSKLTALAFCFLFWKIVRLRVKIHLDLIWNVITSSFLFEIQESCLRVMGDGDKMYGPGNCVKILFSPSSYLIYNDTRVYFLI